MGFDSNRLREAREHAGLTQQQLAAKADLSLRSVARWEAGDGEPLLKHLVAIADATGKPLDYFFRVLA